MLLFFFDSTPKTKSYTLIHIYTLYTHEIIYQTKPNKTKNNSKKKNSIKSIENEKYQGGT